MNATVSQMQQSMTTWMETLAQAETRRQAQIETVIDEQARLMKESLAYAAQLSAEWRKLTLAFFPKS